MTALPVAQPALTAMEVQDISREVLQEKYAKGDELQVDQVLGRVAVALAEAEQPEQRETWAKRFMEALQELSPAMVARFTQIDYDREMALITTTSDDQGAEQMVGIARYSLAADGESVEFALVVADDWQRHGLGRRLMGALIELARGKGFRSIFGDVLGKNAKMLRLMHSLGFLVQPHPEESALRRVVKTLHGK